MYLRMGTKQNAPIVYTALSICHAIMHTNIDVLVPQSFSFSLYPYHSTAYHSTPYNIIRVLAAMMALGETSYKYTTVTCILLAAVIHMIQTQSFPEWSFSAFDLDFKAFIPAFDFSHFDLWFYVDILTYTTASTLATSLPLVLICNYVFTVAS